MHFLTQAQIRALAGFRTADVDYAVLDRSTQNPSSALVTFWMHNDSYVTMLITPKGELMYV